MPRLTQFQKEYSQSWHYRHNGAYVPRDGDQVIYENYFVRVVDSDPDPPRNRPKSMKPNIRFHIHFKGTQFTAGWQWRENYAAAFKGQRVPQWDEQLDYVIERYGFDSRDSGHFSHPDGVHYTGFSRGSAMAMYLGGSGYGLGPNPFPAYPPARGSDHHKISEHGFDPLHDWFLTEHLPGNMEASQSAMGIYGGRRPDETQVIDGRDTKKPKLHPVIDTHDKGPDGYGGPLKKDPVHGWIYYKDGKWYKYVVTTRPGGDPSDPADATSSLGDEVTPTDTGGDVAIVSSEPTTPPNEPSKQSAVVALKSFAGLVCTFYDPPTSRILNYKGIPRKRRRNTSLERWSPFWKEHMSPYRHVFDSAMKA